MADLFPPLIEGKLPAQAGTKLKFELQHNPSVNTADNTKLNTKIIGASTGIILAQPEAEYADGFVTVNIGSKLLNPGEYYKIQFGYKESKYYSSVGVFRYINKPTLEAISFNNFNFSTNFIFTNSEPPASYIYNVYKNGVKFSTSGPVLVLGAISNSYKCEYELDEVLDTGEYVISCEVTTINGYKAEKTLKLNITTTSSQNLTNIITKLQPDRGCVEVKITNKSGYKLFRAYNNGRKEMLGVINSTNFVYKDFTFSNEINYYLIIKQTSSTKFLEEYGAVQVFGLEHMYLSDNDRQLCVKFNPTVGSFKDVILEQKMDTIGGRYPFFFRNGDVQYKELQIGGLISYHMDSEQLFSTRTPWTHLNDQGKRTKTPQNNMVNSNLFLPTTNLTDANIIAEQEFKTEVLNWLNNGQPKLFRSPTEGNYIVRLMNVSLSPEQQIGRMLHSFSATAYEIAECTIENLKQYNCCFQEV